MVTNQPGACTTVRAGDNPRFLDLGIGQKVVQCGAEIQLADRASIARRFDFLGISAMIADQPMFTGIEPKVAAALIAGKAMFVDGGNKIGIK